ncbi:hypothetical protein GGR57DRAFT_502141 [Xylariaceae sp. FL1272]|nr:hypothetical protein GGR57DRAFT_502141 [Xylariaceae sp. FL1272]
MAELFAGLQRFSDIHNAQENLHDIVLEIKLITQALEEIYGLVKKEIVDFAHRGRLNIFSESSLVSVRSTADQCLVIFWRVEATISGGTSTILSQDQLTGRLAKFNNTDPNSSASHDSFKLELETETLDWWGRVRWASITSKLNKHYYSREQMRGKHSDARTIVQSSQTVKTEHENFKNCTNTPPKEPPTREIQPQLQHVQPDQITGNADSRTPQLEGHVTVCKAGQQEIRILPYMISDGVAYPLPIPPRSDFKSKFQESLRFGDPSKRLVKKLASLTADQAQTLQAVLQPPVGDSSRKLVELEFVTKSTHKFWRKSSKVHIAFVEDQQSDLQIFSPTAELEGDSDGMQARLFRKGDDFKRAATFPASVRQPWMDIEWAKQIIVDTASTAEKDEDDFELPHQSDRRLPEKKVALEDNGTHYAFRRHDKRLELDHDDARYSPRGQDKRLAIDPGSPRQSPRRQDRRAEVKPASARHSPRGIDRISGLERNDARHSPRRSRISPKRHKDSPRRRLTGRLYLLPKATTNLSSMILTTHP